MNLKPIIDILVQQLNPIAIYVYGSYLTPYFNSESDIDIAVLGGRLLDRVQWFDLQCNLGAIINRDVDLIDLSKSSTVLRIQVLKNNQVLYCRDKEARLNFEMKTISEYIKLNEERKQIIRETYGYDFE